MWLKSIDTADSIEAVSSSERTSSFVIPKADEISDLSSWAEDAVVSGSS